MWVYTTGDNPNNAQCSSCGADITWVQNVATGKKQPIDGHDIGFLRVDEVSDRNGTIVPAGEVELRGDDPMHQSHFSTCPQRDEWRKRR